MLLIAVDGRQRHLSVGLTQPQLAGYMRWLGAYQAMEFDSGGSVTMALRLPWRSAPAVVNSPSDGHERPVANALLIFSMPAANSRWGYLDRTVRRPAPPPAPRAGRRRLAAFGGIERA